MAICDFCSSPNVVKCFGCRDFDADSIDVGVVYPKSGPDGGPATITLKSIDFWAACPDCAALVEARDVPGLVKRALDEFEKQDGHPLTQRRGLEKHLKLTYDLFFDNWTGETEIVA